MATPEETSVRGRLRRADKVMDEAEVRGFLQSAFCGRTATMGADGFPYVVPNLFIWQAGEVWLHTARVDGHFARNVKHESRVCFEVDEPGEVFPYGPIECDTSVSFRSAIVFGRIRSVWDVDATRRFFELFMEKYAPADSWGREKGTFPRLEATAVYAIAPESMTGKAGVLPGVERRWSRPAMAVRPTAGDVP